MGIYRIFIRKQNYTMKNTVLKEFQETGMYVTTFIDGTAPVDQEIEKTSDGKYYAEMWGVRFEIQNPPGIYEIEYETTGTTRVELDNEGISFNCWGEQHTGWTFTDGSMTGYTYTNNGSTYTLCTGTTESCEGVLDAAAIKELPTNRTRVFVINSAKYDYGTSMLYEYERSLDERMELVDKDGWYMETTDAAYAGRYKDTGEVMDVWTSRYSHYNARVMVRESDGLKIFGVAHDDSEYYMEPYVYREWSSSTYPVPSIGHQLRNYTVAVSRPAFNDEFPGVAYDEEHDVVRYNPQFKPLWFTGQPSGHGGGDYYDELLETRTWEECGIDDTMFARYLSAFREGHTSILDFNVKTNGNYCRYRSCNEYTAFFKDGRYSYFYVRIDAGERNVYFGYHEEGMS